MRGISFGWTYPALVARAKRATRRSWVDHYAESFKKNEVLAALDMVRFLGGKQIGVIQLTAKPYKQSTIKMTKEDYIREGFPFLHENIELNPASGRKSPLYPFGWEEFQAWRHKSIPLWVVEFKILDVNTEVPK